MPPFFAYLDGSTQKWKRNITQKKSFTQGRVENENIQNTIAYEKTTNRMPAKGKTTYPKNCREHWCTHLYHLQGTETR